MDLELVLTTILTWMKVQVTDASPWVQWAGAGYAVYWFIRGNWVTLRDFTKGLCWTVRKTGSGLQLANAWRKRPSQLTRLQEEFAALRALVGPKPGDLQPDREARGRLPERGAPYPEADFMPLDIPEAGDGDQAPRHWEANVAGSEPPLVTKQNQAELQTKVDRAVAAAAAKSKEPRARAKQPLDGGTYRGQIDPVFVGGTRVDPKGTPRTEQP